MYLTSHTLLTVWQARITRSVARRYHKSTFTGRLALAARLAEFEKL